VSAKIKSLVALLHNENNSLHRKSLDGFIARKDGDIDWLVKFQNPEVHQSYKEFMDRIDAIVIGIGTFKKVLTFPGWAYEKKVFVLSNSIKIIPAELEEKLTILSMRPKELLTIFPPNRGCILKAVRKESLSCL
jgi:hypothetical protein